MQVEMKGRLDAVSVSLNASNEAEYLRLTRPGMGARGWQAMLDFVKDFSMSVEQAQYDSMRIPALTLLKNVTVTGAE